jgi:hypothetical protein
MKINLIDVDGYHFPNLALMKLSAYHKKKGDFVYFNSVGNFDIIYKSKIFTWTKDKNGFYQGKEIKGGTGYKLYANLSQEIEHICPDYSLYNCESAYGFLTRGCIRKCEWCVVPQKEGILKQNADIEEFISDKKSAILMDNNALASVWGLKQIEKIINLKIKIDFNQGLDARIICNNIDIVKLLSKVKWLNQLRMACDTNDQLEYIIKSTQLLRKYNCKPINYFVYMLVTDIDSALYRAREMKKLKLKPYAQAYRNYEANEQKISKEIKHFCRWINNRPIFEVCDWNEYKNNFKYITTNEEELSCSIKNSLF